MKKILLIILGIVIISLVFVLLNVLNNKSDDNIIYNKMDNIKEDGNKLNKEHCVGTICMNDLNINYNENEISFIISSVINYGTENYSNCIRINLITDQDKYDLKTCLYDLEPDKSYPIQLAFSDDDKYIVNAYDYELYELTDEERLELEKSIV